MFKFKKKQVFKVACIGWLGLLLWEVSIAETEQYYRIIGKDGKVSLQATISPEEVKRGYQVVTLNGVVIKDVPPIEIDSSTPEGAAILTAKREAAKRLYQQKAYEEQLLLKYSNLDDLKAEQRRKVNEFLVRINILKSNKQILQEKIELQQMKAANRERAGQKVPDVIIKNTEELMQQLVETEKSLQQIEAQQQDVKNRYASDAKRLVALLENNEKALKQLRALEQ